MKHPRPGCRYALTYRVLPIGEREFLRSSAEHHLGVVLAECRSRDDRGLREFLTQLVGQVIYKVLEVDSDPSDNWFAYLWSAERSRFEPAFGSFLSDKWDHAFNYGEGVVGHAFRRRGPALYLRRDPRKVHGDPLSSLIYRARSTSEHRWVACVPLLLRAEPELTPIGVLSFSALNPASTPLQSRLERLITKLVADPPVTSADPTSENTDQFALRQLSIKASYIFWESLLRAPERKARQHILGAYKSFVRSVLDDHWRTHNAVSDVAPRPDAPPASNREDEGGSAPA